MPKLWIDNREVEVDAGATVLDAASKLGVRIPTLCYRGGCTPQTSCLVCVVRVNSASRLVPACATVATEGMKVESQTPQVMSARRTALELMLGDHAGDCLAPCQMVCPAHMDIPRMIRQIAAGQLREALVTVKEAIALPAVLGRICPELCEKGCRRGQNDAAVSICLLKRFVADVDLASGQPYMPACAPSSGKRVAVVGAGPAGLAAVYYLRQVGHACALFDGQPQPGGNLRYAVGEQRLPHAVLDAEIALVEALGVEMRLGVRVGTDVTLPELRQQFDAVLLAVGEVDAAKAAALGLAMEGRGLKIDKSSMMTPMEGVFAAGGAVLPLRQAVRSVGQGREAARAIDQYLRGEEPTVAHAPFTVRLGAWQAGEQVVFMAGAVELLRTAPAGEAGQGFAASEAQAEASRCLGCDCGKRHGCRLRQCAIEYHANPGAYRGHRRQFERITTHPHVVYEPGKCIACGLCVQIASQAGEPLGLTYIGRGFDVRIGVPFDEAMAQALQRVARECVEACPTGSLTMKACPVTGGHDATQR